MAFQPVKGAEDFYPEEKEVQAMIFASLRQSARSFGFQEVESPAIESLKLLAAKSGEEIKSQLFTFEKKGSEELALRFDLTVPFTRMFVARQKELAKPVKWFGISRMWRYEAPQKGRFREFYQLSCELFGADRPEADAEVINLSIDCLKRFGLGEKDFYVKINNRKLLEGLLLQAGMPKRSLDEVTRAIDKKAKVSDDEFVKELLKAGLNQETVDNIKKFVGIKGSAEQVFSVLKKQRLGKESLAGLDELEKVLNLVDENYVVVDLSLARGLAYYTGTVFELSDRQDSFRAIAGGGRYDSLVQTFGGQPEPATGFAMGDKVLKLVLEQKGKLPKPELGPDYYVIGIGDVQEELKDIVAKLREKYSVDFDLQGRKLGKQFEYANSIGAKKVVVVGPQELEMGKVKVKDMKTGKEELVDVKKL